MVERFPVTEEVTGSNPAGRAMKKTLSIVVMILLFSGVYLLYDRKIQEQSGMPIPIPATASDESSVDVQTEPFVRVGDRLGGMTVVHVEPFNTGQYSQSQASTELGPENVRLLLTGPISITGTYSFVDSAIGFTGYCMTNFDAVSLSRLPTLPGTAPAPLRSLCFRNVDFVKQKLGTQNRRITAVVDNYELNAYPSEMVDYADLIE